MLTAEAIGRIEKLAKDGNRVTTIQPPGEPSHVYLLITPDGVERKEADVGPREHSLFAIGDFAKAVQKYGNKPIIFVGKGKITAVLDDGATRRNTLQMPLEFSHEFEQLSHMDRDRKPLSQKGLLSVLQVDLPGAVSSDTIALFRSLRFEKTEAGESAVKTSKESIGRKVQTEVFANGNEIPEEIAATICVYKNIADVAPDVGDGKHGVKCVVQTDFTELTFTVIPVAGRLDEILMLEDARIQKMLQTDLGDDIPVLLGSP